MRAPTLANPTEHFRRYVLRVPVVGAGSDCWPLVGASPRETRRFLTLVSLQSDGRPPFPRIPVKTASKQSNAPAPLARIRQSLRNSMICEVSLVCAVESTHSPRSRTLQGSIALRDGAAAGRLLRSLLEAAGEGDPAAAIERVVTWLLPLSSRKPLWRRGRNGRHHRFVGWRDRHRRSRQ